jgi:hypothetical protein
MRALKVLLETFNVKIDPEEVERAWLQAKDALPKLAKAAEEMNARQARMEIKVDEILARLRLLPELEITPLTIDTEEIHAGTNA